MRITTSMMISNYQSNLNASVNNLNNAQMHVLSQRNFNSVSENPAAAIRAASLERSYAKNEDYISLVKDLHSRVDSQESSIKELVTYAEQIAKDEGLKALNGTNTAQAKVYAESFRGLQQSMVRSLNMKFGDNYVMAGSDCANLPFQLSEDGKTLTFRGIDVSTGLDKDGNPANPSLEKMAKETMYVDLGFGLTSDASGAILPSSAFDIALSGLNVVGFGKDANGMDNNLIVLAGQLAESLESDPPDLTKMESILGQFNKGFDTLVNAETNLGVKSNFLDNTQNRLEDTAITLATQIDAIVNADMPTAITNYSYAQYAYNAALRVGVNILSPSFIDFMK